MAVIEAAPLPPIEENQIDEPVPSRAAQKLVAHEFSLGPELNPDPENKSAEPAEPAEAAETYPANINPAEIETTPAAGIEVAKNEVTAEPSVKQGVEEVYVGSSYEMFRRSAEKFKLLTAKEEVELAKRIENGDQAAKGRMIVSNLRLVASIARKFQYVSQLELMDCIQEGVLGLMKAVDKFDYRRGFKFSSLATSEIRSAVQYAILQHGRNVHIPIEDQRAMRKLSTAEKNLKGELGRKPTTVELAAKTGIKAERVEVLNIARLAPTSLNRSVSSEDGSSELGEILPTVPNGEDVVVNEVAENMEAIRARVYEKLERLLQKNPELLRGNEREIFVRLHGLLGKRPRNHDEIAAELNLKPDSVKSLESRANKNLAKALSPEQLKAA